MATSCKRTKLQRPLALQQAVRQVEQRWGTHASGRFFGVSPSLSSLSTGIPELDSATGFGGIPRGRISELTGPASSGKLTLSLQVLRSALNDGGLVAYIDVPGEFYPAGGVALGLDLSRLVMVCPPNATTALGAAATLLHSDGFDAVLMDLGTAQPHTNCFSNLADLSRRGGTGLIVITECDGTGLTRLSYFTSLRLGVKCRGWRWRCSRMGNVPTGLTLEVRVLKSRNAAGAQGILLDSPFFRRQSGPQDTLRMDALLPHYSGSHRAPSLFGTAARDLRDAV